MAQPKAQVCDVMIDGAWHTIGLDEAHTRHRDAVKRCPACHGRVTSMGRYGGFSKVRLQHRQSHDGCPLTVETFSGTASPHPEAQV